eukprot:1954531-Rhodomonas_salina.2
MREGQEREEERELKDREETGRRGSIRPMVLRAGYALSGARLGHRSSSTCERLEKLSLRLAHLVPAHLASVPSTGLRIARA